MTGIFGHRLTPRNILREQDGGEGAERVARVRRWPLIGGNEEDREGGVDYERIWLTQYTLTFHYRLDHIGHIGYTYLSGDDDSHAAQLESELVGDLDVRSADELLRAVDEADTEGNRGHAILRAGIGAPMEFDEHFYAAIVRAMRDPSDDLRRVGVLACGYSPWPRYRPVLRELAAHDTEESVRDLAEAALRAFDQHGIGES